MGSFSVLFAEQTKGSISENLVVDMPFKVLIPQEFGGGYYLDNGYQDYGRVTDIATGITYDWYDLLAYWNLKYLDEEVLEKYSNLTEPPKDGEFDGLRGLGIDIDFYSSPHYPLKIVPIDYEGTYEDCEGVSENDPNQGFGVTLIEGKFPVFESLIEEEEVEEDFEDLISLETLNEVQDFFDRIGYNKYSPEEFLKEQEVIKSAYIL